MVRQCVWSHSVGSLIPRNPSIKVILLKDGLLGMGQYCNHGMWVEAKFSEKKEGQINGGLSGLMAFAAKRKRKEKEKNPL